MTYETRRSGIIIDIQTFLCSLLTVFMAAHGTASDAYCLKSIKVSLEDPFGYLSSSWDFYNIADENTVLDLQLSMMGLKGQFPRAIQNCSSLERLNLSFNELSGPIPSDISELLPPFVVSIDLSNNNFSGEIPASLGNCTYLNDLKLDNNMFCGKIPPELGLLTRIITITFANNHLSGPVPAFGNGLATVDSYANNSGLCGGPLAPCSSSGKGFHFHQSFKFKDGFIVGFAFSFTSVVVVYMSYCSPWMTQLKQTKNNHRSRARELGKYVCSVLGRKSCIESNQTQELLPLQLQDRASTRISKLVERLTSTMRFDELSDATDCFSIDKAIGVGKMGIMYNGVLPNGWHLAVKRTFDSQVFGRQILLEIRILGKLRHRNLVPLLGFCMEGMEKILVYQYMSNGRLSKWLHPLESEVMRLKWPERIKIALGVARALSWLHHTCNLHIVHFNISSECIMLDKNFEPKLSNFGEAKFMNPDNGDDLGMTFYVKDGKKDVYDFGSVLFELVTGKTFKELLCSSNIASLCGDPSNFYNAIDESLMGEGFENEIFTLIKIACECVQPFADQRPSMLQVYNNMSNVWEGQHGLTDDSDMPAQSEIVSAADDSDEIVEL